MSSVMEVIEYTPELLNEIVVTIKGANEKVAAIRIIESFYNIALPIKIKRYFLPQLSDTFRVLCFIKKSSEAVIINTDGFGVEGMNIQLRILNNDSFARLDELNDNIRNQILNASDCRYCSSKCNDKKYVFVYDEKKFTKCQYLCANFRLQVADEDDISSLIALIKREFDFAARKKIKK